MCDPLSWLRTSEVGMLLLLSSAAALAWMTLFPNVNTRQAPRGVISLQLAFTAEKAEAILASWRRRHLDGPARRSQFTDFGYILCYLFVLALLGVISARAAHASGFLGRGHAQTAAALLAIGALATAFLDVVEDIGLLVQIGKGARAKPGALLVAATSSVSAAKWTLAGVVLLGSIVLLFASLATWL
jgi:hypothetical protein